MGLVLPGNAGKWHGTPWALSHGDGFEATEVLRGKVHPCHQLPAALEPCARALGFLPILYFSRSPVPAPHPHPSPGRGAGHSTGAPGRPRSDRPAYPSPSLTHHDTQQPEAQLPPRQPLGRPGPPRAVPAVPLPERQQLPLQRRGGTRLPALGHAPPLLRGAEEVRAGTSPGGARPIPSRPGPRRPGAPRPHGETPALGRSCRSPPAPTGARRGPHAANTPRFVARIIHTSRCFNLSLPEVRIPKRFVVRSFYSCNQSMNAPLLFCVRRSAQRGNLWR